MAEKIVNVRNIVKKFGEKVVLNNISFSVNYGEIFGLIGPNGAGKTTTLRCLYGDLFPDRGEIEIFGNKFDQNKKDRIAVLTESRISFSKFRGEDYRRLWSMLYPKWNEEIFNNFIMHYNLDLRERVENYSAGMRVVMNLALTISSGAELLILDEPTLNLDPVIKTDALRVFKDFVKEENRSIVISSHEIYELEEIADAFAIIKEGRIIYTDTVDEAKSKHRIGGRNEKISGTIVGTVGDEILYRTDKDEGRYPTLMEISIAYIQGQRQFAPFERSDF
ncbi:MAG: ABC transporter ATP-binding protein [Mesoaciditoga sp.]|uniref:ABC transporter ATP-binding protein n=1 Tax=Athalassotoga sp. TaxID=2022597 RepID=UPI000CC1827F|nr:MAG: ABC transporter ATP-binding protein [Mesoaciditoga sp.]PMP78698.1 MAG: ABC transporter ATP-binding protein [Mesoaciditoga sp.]HEU24308.1 ABC transporter ATP-binding protein [Mesoaciditoga lauensis]